MCWGWGPTFARINEAHGREGCVKVSTVSPAWSWSPPSDRPVAMEGRPPDHQVSLGTAGIGSRGCSSAMYFSGYFAHSASNTRFAISRLLLSANCARVLSADCVMGASVPRLSDLTGAERLVAADARSAVPPRRSPRDACDTSRCQRPSNSGLCTAQGQRQTFILGLMKRDRNCAKHCCSN
jgi:hypothetical protein